MNPEVAAIIVTHRRPEELRRLLEGLAAQEPRPALVVVVDNAADARTPEIVRTFPGASEMIALPGNPGPGAAWKCGMEHALTVPRITHLWALDDDVAAPPGILGRLLSGMEKGGGEVIAPLLSDADGRLWGFPEPADPALRGPIRQAVTPADCLRLLGAGPHRFTWCTGASVLFTRKAITECGFHRTDFFILGEDIELSMRMAARFPCVFVADAVMPHLPPPPPAGHGEQAARWHYIKFLSLLQNLTYLSLRVPHSAHMRRYLAGNYRRFFATFGWHLSTVRDALACLRGGWFGAQPAGGPLGKALRARKGF